MLKEPPASWMLSDTAKADRLLRNGIFEIRAVFFGLRHVAALTGTHRDNRGMFEQNRPLISIPRKRVLAPNVVKKSMTRLKKVDANDS
ncbi:hypothetical protein [Paraburkholderia sp. Cpub6]|uniref:hypothetical protein n=1 Tax=Paraburkholderia sp. Cpub6 TaxID=2723094 RepID=UPI00161F6227|nr:hypothetical protein [Paraburkholderia sp. Cpub6]MBB5460216.1 hypothetical protein [Paraburkholderia sp. Cpub6]